MLNFQRIEAGCYLAKFEGAKLNIVREGQSYWALRLDGEFVNSFKTLGDARVGAHDFIGVPVASAPAAKPVPRAKKAKLPAIMHSKHGLYIFGLDEVCEMLAESYTDAPDLAGEVCRPHVTRRGAKGYFVNAPASDAFWDVVSQECEGQRALCVEGRSRVEVTL